MDKFKHRPPWSNLVDLEEVPEEKSSLSTSPTRSPLVAASSATPQPVAPPPTTRMSRGLTALEPISADSCTALEGTTPLESAIFRRTASSEGPPRSLEEIGGSRRVTPAESATATATVPIRLRRVEVLAMDVIWCRREQGKVWAILLLKGCVGNRKDGWKLLIY